MPKKNILLAITLLLIFSFFFLASNTTTSVYAQSCSFGPGCNGPNSYCAAGVCYYDNMTCTTSTPTNPNECSIGKIEDCITRGYSGCSRVYAAGETAGLEFCCYLPAPIPTPTPTPTPSPSCVNDCTPNSSWCVSNTTYNVCDAQISGCWYGGSVRSCPSGYSCDWNTGSCVAPTPVNYCSQAGYSVCTPGQPDGTCTLNGQTCTSYTTYE